MPFLKSILFNKLSYCIITLIVCEGFGIDLFIQDMLFKDGHWMIQGNPFDLILYSGPKAMVILFSVISIIIGYKFKEYRKHAICFILGVVMIPLSVAILKQTTCIYCPKQIFRYGGEFPYLSILQSQIFFFQNTVPKGICFPAGHASCGFSLLTLPLMFPRYKNFLLIMIIGFSSTMAFYQMARGQHYLSHSLITMIIAFGISKYIYNKSEAIKIKVLIGS